MAGWLRQTSTSYLVVRRYVDAQFAARSLQYKVLLLPAGLPFAILAPLMRGEDWLLWSCVGWAVLWIGFVGWRGMRMLRANAKKSDRVYDRRTKFELAREYWTTESATQTRRGKRKPAPQPYHPPDDGLHRPEADLALSLQATAASPDSAQR